MTGIEKLPPIPSATSITPVGRPAETQRGKIDERDPRFGSLLDNELQQSEPVKFSAHAQNRLQSRQINLSSTQMSRLQQGVGEAERKGARDSLVLLDNLAFVVSVRNRTVVTALDNALQTGRVFTNIDSTVLA